MVFMDEADWIININLDNVAVIHHGPFISNIKVNTCYTQADVCFIFFELCRLISC